MDVVNIFNGLGNQMSQYAFYLQKKHINRNTKYLMTDADHQGFELEKLFGIKLKRSFILFKIYSILVTPKHKIFYIIFNKIIFGGLHLIREKKTYDFDVSNLKNKHGINFYVGGWHSEKNFKDVIDEIRQIYTFPQVKDDVFLRIKHQIENSVSVSLHVRHGDYLNSTTEWDFSHVCTDLYYQRAIEYIYSNVKNPVFFVFSDDLEYVRKKFSEDCFVIVDINRGKDSWRDMYLMSLCKHNIMANSSFSWWGAWLNKNPDKIVLHPKRFLRNYPTQDFYCENWITIES